MTTQQVIFILISLLTIVSGLFVVTNRNLFHAAIALMASFLGVAGMYAMLEAGFLAAAQLLVYIGAISILMIFAIMMTRRLMSTTESAFNSQWIQSLVVAFISFAILATTVIRFWGTEDAALAQTFNRGMLAPEAQDMVNNSVVELGQVLVSADGYVVPFEVASVLLLAALVGSIYIALPEKRK